MRFFFFLAQARLNWIHSCQQEVYWKELKNVSTPQQKRLPLVRQLCLFWDDKGFLICGGQIHNAPLTNDAKFPYLLPSRHPFTALIVVPLILNCIMQEWTTQSQASVRATGYQWLDKWICQNPVTLLYYMQETWWQTLSNAWSCSIA